MAYAELRDTLRIRLPGALDGGINLELFNVIDEWCRRTNAYREFIETTLTVGQDTYAIAPAGLDPIIIYQVVHPTLDISGAIYDAGQITLPNAPDATDATEALITEASVAPLYGTGDPEDWLPEALYQRFHQALIDGVLSRMHSQPAKPYSDVRRAEYHGRRLRNHMRTAIARVVGDSEVSPQRWAFPRFGR
jgi:hypothetical protein